MATPSGDQDPTSLGRRAGFDALGRAVDVVNSLLGPPDPEADRAALVAVMRAHGETRVHLDDHDVAELRGASEALRRLLDTSDPDLAASLLNDMLARTTTAPYLSNHEQTGWHLHVEPVDASWGRWLLSSSALAFAQSLSRFGSCAWGRCASASCGRYFVHDGRGAPRRYCSTRCATRERVAAHRRAGRTDVHDP